MDNDIKQETYNDFESHVSPLDPNMSSVARYSPIYNADSNSFNNPIVVTRLVSNSNNGTNYVCSLSNTDNNALTTDDIRQVVNTGRFLQMVNETDGVQDDTTATNTNATTGELPIDNEQEVELLITDQATGIRSKAYKINRKND